MKYKPFHIRVVAESWYGSSDAAIARKFDITPVKVKEILEMPESQAIFEELQAQTLDTMGQVGTRAQAVAPEIMEEKINLALHSTDDRVKNSACKDILEIAGHTPIKRIQLAKPESTAESRYKDMTEDELREQIKQRLGRTDKDLDPGRILN